MKLSHLGSVLVLCLLAVTAQANIIFVGTADSGCGGISCQGSWNPNTPGLFNLVSTQNQTPGSVAVGVLTDTPDDPTLGIFNTVNNDGTFAWTAYQVNVYMNRSFSLFGDAVTTPGDWSAAITAQGNVLGSYVDAVDSNTYSYMATILYTSGTPIGIGGELDFSYDLTFLGSTNYSYAQEAIPLGIAPEPATMGLGLAGLIARRRAKK